MTEAQFKQKVHRFLKTRRCKFISLNKRSWPDILVIGDYDPHEPPHQIVPMFFIEFKQDQHGSYRLQPHQALRIEDFRRRNKIVLVIDTMMDWKSEISQTLNGFIPKQEDLK